MIRIGLLLILAALTAMTIPPATSNDGRAATPAGPAATPAPLVLGETPGSVPIALFVENRGDEADRLIGGSTPVARSVAVHRARLDDGVRVMLPAPDGLAIPGDSIRILEPESDHLMLIDVQEDLVQGAAFPLTLHFARAGKVTVTVRVRRKLDAAGITLAPPVVAGEIAVSLASAPPAPAAP